MGTKYAGTPEERLALDTYIKLSRAAEHIGHCINGHLADDGLTTSQFGVLEALYHLGPLPVGKLGEKILKSSGNMTLVIDNLVRRGLVERVRRDDDRRTVEVRLTPAGRMQVAALLPGHVAGVVSAFAALTPDEQAALGGLCRKLGRSLSGPQGRAGEAVTITHTKE
jgi:MarR family 2-MHQ and catechol resistance regulon transcriptional repressor